MPCYFPLTAFQDVQGGIHFSERKGSDILRTLSLPCGRCVGCRLERSRQWAVRCLHESKSHRSNCFITLTYDPEFLPEDWSLDYVVFQKFLKRMRKRLGPFRYYMCGEYGEDFGRPHYHACIFGLDFDDKVLISDRAGTKLYNSATLRSLWGFGNVSIGELNFETAAYTARYIMKKITGDAAKEHYRFVVPATGEIVERMPEFCHMSLKPGIGADWLDKFHKDVYRFDYVVVRGRESKPPRYYDRRFSEKIDADRFEEIAQARIMDSVSRSADNTTARLRVKAKVAEARISSFKRSL